MGTNAYYYLYPIGRHPKLKRMWIIRPTKTLKGEIPHGEFVLVPSRFRIWRFMQMFWFCLRIGRREDVRACISFNPVPYGMIALVAAFFNRKPVHLGFVGGLDWDHHAKGRFGRWLRPFFRRADFFTVTGTRMRLEMIDHGFPAEKIKILPHGIDVENYPISDPKQALYGCVYVGQLITRKRVDVIIRAIATLHKTLPAATLLIVGGGPEEGHLKALAAELGLLDAITFAGFQEHVQPFLAQARLLVMASEMEGLPFAIVEAMCSGLVPISTPVGTVEDLIVHGENGLLFPQEDHQALARFIASLLEDEDRYQSLRSEALKVRQTYSFAAATAVWDRWFKTLDRGPS
jgi:glycosyltransferase involved in cell wall biosynthesis